MTDTEPLVVRPGFPSVELLEAFVALMPDAAVVIDAEGRIASANGLTEALFGYSVEELAGRPIETLIPERFRHEHRHNRSDYSASPRPRPMGAGLDLAGRRRDGSEFPVDISLAPVPGVDAPLVVAAIRDATERNAAKAAQAQLAAIVQSSQDGVISMTVAGGITSWNPGAEALLGYTPGEILGEHVSRLVPPDESAVLEELLDAAVTDHIVGARDTRQLRKDGSRVDVALSVSPVRDSAARLVGFSWVMRDITTRKEAEAELRRLLVEEHRRERSQADAAEVRLALLSGVALDECLTLICQHACALADADTAVIAIGAPNHMTVRAGAGRGTALVGERDFAPQVVEPGPGASVPIGCPDDEVGVLRVVRLDGGAEFSPGDTSIMAGLADQAALALQAGHARDDHERLLLGADRDRIARDLHDLVIQRLFAAGMTLQSIVGLIDDDRALERVSGTVDELDTTIRDIRTAIFTLERPTHQGSGPRSQILALAARAGEGLGFEPSVRFDGPVDGATPDHVVPHVIAVVRESLSNISRHAHASRVGIDLSVRDAVVLVVEDDGVGAGDTTRTSGLANLRDRAESLDGIFTVTMPSGGGTRIRWQVPLAPS